jgi:hypothetical protein
MRQALAGLFASACVVLVVFATIALADEKAEKVPPDKLPAKVADAIKARFPGCEITSAEKEKEDGKIVYDIELKHKDRKYEMDILEDGTIIEIEKEVALKDLPEAVKKAVEEKYAKSTIKEAMEVNKVEDKKETPIHYEITIETAEKKKMEIIVSLDGKSVKTEGEK